ncbi:MAG: hypothetical protein JWM98_306 [Thermoleophilia bacterium]|nr:hypothetical protein [Thermoleophilia bacterium]
MKLTHHAPRAHTPTSIGGGAQPASVTPPAHSDGTKAFHTLKNNRPIHIAQHGVRLLR